MIRTRQFLFALFLIAAPTTRAQTADSATLTVQRIFGSREFQGESFGPARWLGDGSAYITLEATSGGTGRDRVGMTRKRALARFWSRPLN